MAAILYCRHCNTGYTTTGMIPPVCPGCLRTGNWTTKPGPKIAYQLTNNDKRFLKTLRIQPEDDAR
jgi:hypothetical protein